VAALVAAALYLMPSAVLAPLTGDAGWGWWVLLASATTVLVLYGRRTGAPLRVLAIVIVLGFTEFVAAVGSAIGDRCGDSRLASDLELVGTIAILVALGAWAVRRGRIWWLPLGVVVAGVWVVAIAHLIPGGAGGCFE
jgi:hypothetical protein